MSTQLWAIESMPASRFLFYGGWRTGIGTGFDEVFED